MEINKKTFRLSNKISKSFSMAINNFQMVVTFLFRIRPKIRLGFALRLRTKLVTLLSIKKVRLSAITSLIQNIVQTVSIKKIKLSYVIRERLSSFPTIDVSQNIFYSFSQRQKVSGTISAGILSLVIDPILAKLFLLIDFDLDTLDVLDVQTLGDMDYVLA
jgi:hypothetical protein